MIHRFERVDADRGVKMVVNPAGDDGHYSAPGADVELCRSGSECVFGNVGGIFNRYLQGAARIGRPYATVLGAKRAGASARRDCGGLRLPGEGEGDVPAVALTTNQHACVSSCRGTQGIAKEQPKRSVV